MTDTIDKKKFIWKKGDLVVKRKGVEKSDTPDDKLLEKTNASTGVEQDNEGTEQKGTEL